jgi:hypothetical protein
MSDNVNPPFNHLFHNAGFMESIVVVLKDVR